MFKLLLAEIRIKKYALFFGIGLITLFFTSENNPSLAFHPNYDSVSQSMSFYGLVSVLIYFFIGRQDYIFMYSRIKLKWYKLAPIRIILPVLYFLAIIALTRALEYFIGFKLFSDTRLASIFISSGLFWWTLFTCLIDLISQKKVQEKLPLWKTIILIFAPTIWIVLYGRYFGAFLDPYIFDLRSLDTPTSAAITFCAALALTSISLYVNRLRLAKSRAINIKD